MKEIKNIIRKTLNEEMGVQMEVKKISKEMTERILLFLSFHLKQEMFKNGLKTKINYLCGDEHSTPIEELIVDIVVEKSDTNNVNGNFAPDKTFRINNGFLVEINLNIKLQDNIEELRKEIISVISHELNHAFVFIKKYDKKSANHNRTNRFLKLGFDGYPELKQFIDMLYLITEEEVQARVQETGSLLDEIEAESFEEALRELYRFQPINDAARMAKYRVEKLLSKVPEEILADFVKAFKANNKSFGINKKAPNEPRDFFLYYQRVIAQQGIELNKKILKLTFAKFGNNKIIQENTFEKIGFQLSNSIEGNTMFEHLFGCTIWGTDCNDY